MPVTVINAQATDDGIRYEFLGDSTDPKQTEDLAVNSLFLELDTKTIYYFNGTSWSVYGGE